MERAKLRPADRLAALPSYFFHGLNQKIAQLKAAGVDVIRMDMGSPDLPPAPFVVEALKKSADDPARHGRQVGFMLLKSRAFRL